MKKRLLRIIEICFVCGVALLLAAGLGRALFAPKEVVQYENRKAEKLPAFSMESFLSAEFQEDVETALADQVHGAELLKIKYNETDSGIAFPCSRASSCVTLSGFITTTVFLSGAATACYITPRP